MGVVQASSVEDFEEWRTRAILTHAEYVAKLRLSMEDS